MKKVISILFCVLMVSTQVYAQQWVSTSPQNKNVILEEFTGIYCQFCPDGHRIASEIAEANPGRVFLINIHAGNYAANHGYAGYIDLQTPEGTALDAASNNTYGYPGGSVNRNTSPSWIMGRDQWASAAATVMAQASPVNVFVKSSVDLDTRKLTTEVEFYYTDNSTSNKNYLTVMLTQDNILGPQVDGGNYNPTNWTWDGLYRHNHALRKVLTSGGAFGESIDTTTKGHYEYRKYVTDLPAAINSINVELFRLKVVAFVAEGEGNIYSGYGTEVDFNHNKKFDLGLEAKPTTIMVGSNIIPKMDIINNSDNIVTNFDISLYFNNQEHKKTFTGSLAKGEKTTVDWGNLSIGTGINKLIYSGFSNINADSSNYDINYANDFSPSTVISLRPKAFSTVLGGFDDGTVPADFYLDSTLNKNFGAPLWVDQTSGQPIFLGANSTRSAILYYLHYSWGLAGKGGDILFGEADLSKLTRPALTYYYAYSDGYLNGTPPVVKVQVSADQGASWNLIDSLTLTQTAAGSNSALYIPATTDYQTVELSLSAYKNKSVIIKITGIPGTSGNAMYIDEISIGESTDVTEPSYLNNNSLYPNPADISIQLSDVNNLGKEYSIYSSIGLEVLKGYNENNKIDIKSLNPGLYYIRINNTSMSFVKI